MLEYLKTILQKVSFDAKLFEKELRKAIRSLRGTELKELRNWCYLQFGSVYRMILNRHFSKAT
ncbi:hypothetical protein QWY31_11060 [Cytophagales bacterium LB-30]|uniref:Uncharacterized protein n=1 Tax=Shiella aurantiaca TaxID=3058365 RepID=A0ABT8F729_9BACT|nr:hypothetical protein [Shiella aurantiaca]